MVKSSSENHITINYFPISGHWVSVLVLLYFIPIVSLRDLSGNIPWLLRFVITPVCLYIGYHLIIQSWIVSNRALVYETKMIIRIGANLYKTLTLLLLVYFISCVIYIPYMHNGRASTNFIWFTTLTIPTFVFFIFLRNLFIARRNQITIDRRNIVCIASDYTNEITKQTKLINIPISHYLYIFQPDKVTVININPISSQNILKSTWLREYICTLPDKYRINPINISWKKKAVAEYKPLIPEGNELV